jgi:hypothetical protein
VRAGGICAFGADKEESRGGAALLSSASVWMHVGSNVSRGRRSVGSKGMAALVLVTQVWGSFRATVSRDSRAALFFCAAVSRVVVGASSAHPPWESRCARSVWSYRWSALLVVIGVCETAGVLETRACACAAWWVRAGQVLRGCIVHVASRAWEGAELATHEDVGVTP